MSENAGTSENIKAEENSERPASNAKQKLRKKPRQIDEHKENAKFWIQGHKDYASKSNFLPGYLSSEEWQLMVDAEEKGLNGISSEVMRLFNDSDVMYGSDRDCYSHKSQKSEHLTTEETHLKLKTGRMKFRKVFYDDGEFEDSNLSIPPSPTNPHPFDPSSLPPIISHSLLPYVNHVPLLQVLVDLGVDLFEIDRTTNLGKHLLRLNFGKDVKPKMQWLASLGFQPEDIGEYLSRNPFFLIQDLKDMQARTNYLESKKFVAEDILKVVKNFRYWLNVDVKTMDARLGWIQQQFRLTGDDVRSLIVKEPRIVMFGLGPLQRLVNLFNVEFEFSPKQIKQILLNDPRVFMMDSKYITMNYRYVYRVMGLSNSIIADNPFLLRCSLSSIRNRHEFLKELGKANYVGSRVAVENKGNPVNNMEENTIELKDFLHPSDVVFANKAANTYLVVYNKFLRSH